MLKPILLLLLLNFTFTAAHAQLTTYLGVETSYANDVFIVQDKEEKIYAGSLDNMTLGFSLNQEIHKNFTLETGFMSKNFFLGYSYSDFRNFEGTRVKAFRAWQIPVRLRALLNLHEDKIFLTTITGYNFYINRDFGPENKWESDVGKHPSLNESAVFTTGLEKNFSLLETGAGLEFRFINGISLSFTTSYFMGFKTLGYVDIEYKKNNQNFNPQVITRGDYWNIACSLRYPISNFWHKNTQQEPPLQ